MFKLVSLFHELEPRQLLMFYDYHYDSYSDRVKIVFLVCVIMATNFLELATTLEYLGAKWLQERKVNFTPCNI